MRIKKHADNTEKLFGYRAEDIHNWIDQYFDKRCFRIALRTGFYGKWNPYEHRKYLHALESLPEAQEKFKDLYPEEIIEKVFLQHMKDDYRGYIPVKADFENPDFLRKYHRKF